MNVTFTGNIQHNEIIAYRLYYKSINDNNSIWSSIRYTESGIDQYNINLFDDDILSDNGYYEIGDEVYLLFWTPSGYTNIEDIQEYSYIKHTLDSRKIYIQNVELLPHHAPSCNFTISAGYVDSKTIIYDTGTNDDYEWMYDGHEHHQSCKIHDQIAFAKNCMPSGSINIDYGDGNIDNGIDLSDFPINHSYMLSGDYDISIYVNNSDNLTCIHTENIRIRHNVYNGISYTEPIRIYQPHTINPSISGSVHRISGVDYYIDGNLEFSNLSYDESFTFTFHSVGEHIIKQCIKYNDGFDDVEKCEEFVVKMATIPHYTEEDFQCGTVFISDGVIGMPNAVNYRWSIYHGNDLLSMVEGPTQTRFFYSFPYIGIFRVLLEITDQYKTYQYMKEYDIDKCIGDDVGSGGGGGSPWVYREYKESIPVIKILDVDEDISDMKFLITNVVEV